MKTEKNIIDNNAVKVITILLALVLTILVFLLLNDIGKIQGNARVINYAGIVRGATQRLVKLEITDNSNQDLIIRLDGIINGLQNGSDEYNLVALQDENYQKKLALLIAEWDRLKEDIYQARTVGYENTDLLMRSELYFHMADDTVAAAEVYADQLANHISNIEYLVILDIAIMILILFSQMISSIKIVRKNHELSSIVHIDAQTKIPNKLSCENRLSVYDELPADKVCGCAMFDLNNLKPTNDSFGHNVGDILIIEFARILRESFPSEVFVGRYGGDEFIAIFEDLTREDVDKCIETLKQHSIALRENYPFKIEFAYGYMLSNESEATNLTELLHYADAKMYANKIESKKGNIR